MSAPVPLSNAERQRRFRQAQREAGAGRVEVILDAAATAKLEAWMSKGKTASEVVSMLLRRSKP